MRKAFFYSLLMIFFLNHDSFSQAAEASKSLIEDLGSRAIESLTKQNTPQSTLESNFQALLKEGFDMPAIGKFVMGRHWARMTPAQQGRFIPLFEHHLVKSYANRFQEYTGVVLKVRNVRSIKDQYSVTSTIQKPGSPPTDVDWRVKGQRIQDVRIEGISMSITIRDEFGALIQKNGNNMDAFLKDLDTSNRSSNSE